MQHLGPPYTQTNCPPASPSPPTAKVGALSRSSNRGRAPRAAEGGGSPPDGRSGTQAAPRRSRLARSWDQAQLRPGGPTGQSLKPDVSPWRLVGTATTAAVDSQGTRLAREGPGTRTADALRLEERPARAGSGTLGTPGGPAYGSCLRPARRDSYGGARPLADPRPPACSPPNPGNLRRAGAMLGAAAPALHPRRWRRPAAERPGSSAPSRGRKGRATAGRHLPRASRPLRRSAPGSREAQSQAGPLDPPQGSPAPHLTPPLWR